MKENRKTRKIKKYLDKQLSNLEKKTKDNKNITIYKVKPDENGKIIHKSNKGINSIIES